MDTIERNRRDTVAARAEFGFFEAWKRVADRKAHLIFSLPLDGPTLTDRQREVAVDNIFRLTWLEACEGMAEEERIAARRENRDAMNRYSLDLAERAAAEQWESALAVTR